MKDKEENMIKEIRNSVSIVGNISFVAEEKENVNGRKYLFFDICQNSKYILPNGEEQEDKQFFSIKAYPKELERYKELIKVGKWIHVIGYIHAYIDSKNIRHNYIVLNQLRELNNKDEKIQPELFNYDWLNDEDEK